MKTLILLVAFVACTYALPTGAPLPACTTFSPASPHTGPAQAAPSPFELILNDFMATEGPNNGSLIYNPGVYYDVIIQVRNFTGNRTFRGFLVQAINSMSDPVGTFLNPPPGSDAQVAACPGDTAATHTNNNDKTSVTLRWRAPTDPTIENITFRYTTVEVRDTFWVAEVSQLVMRDPDVVCPTVVAGASAITSLGFWALLGTAIMTALKISY